MRGSPTCRRLNYVCSTWQLQPISVKEEEHIISKHGVCGQTLSCTLQSFDLSTLHLLSDCVLEWCCHVKSVWTEDDSRSCLKTQDCSLNYEHLMTSSVWSCHHKDTLSVSEGWRLSKFFQGQEHGAIWKALAECSSCQLSHGSPWGWHWWLQCIPVMLMFCLQCFPCGLSLGCSLQCCELTLDCWSEMITCGLEPFWVMVVTLCVSSVIRLWIQSLFLSCSGLVFCWLGTDLLTDLSR